MTMQLSSKHHRALTTWKNKAHLYLLLSALVKNHLFTVCSHFPVQLVSLLAEDSALLLGKHLQLLVLMQLEHRTWWF